MDNYREFTEEEIKWIKSFRRVMKKAPNSLILFAGGYLAICPLDENNKRYEDNTGGMDGMVRTENIHTKMLFDSVDW